MHLLGIYKGNMIVKDFCTIWFKQMLLNASPNFRTYYTLGAQTLILHLTSERANKQNVPLLGRLRIRVITKYITKEEQVLLI